MNADSQARKRARMDVLYCDYSGLIRRFLFRKRLGKEEVADIVQETYCRIYKLKDMESIKFPRALLIRIAGNLAHNFRKHQRVVSGQGLLDADRLDIPDEYAVPGRELQAEQELALVSAAYNELSPKCRRVLVMNRFENRSYPQIARELGVSVSAIEKYVSQALAHMRTRLTDGVGVAPVRVLKKR